MPSGRTTPASGGTARPGPARRPSPTTSAAHPERATPLSDAQRDQVKVGDIAQFDWDNSGDRDHTAIVTRVDKTASGMQIYYAGHTNDTDFSRSTIVAIAGGSRLLLERRLAWNHTRSGHRRLMAHGPRLCKICA